MTIERHRSCRGDHWIDPRPHSDPNLRLQKHGPIRPMHERTPRWLLFAIIALISALAWIVSELRPYLPEGF